MTTSAQPIDPVSFEIIRHRLWRITEEQAKIVVRMSGSPITYEAKDFSTGILTPDGQGLFISTYQSSIGVTMCSVAKAVIERFGSNIAPGDMFFSNDPWVGGVGHPNDQALVGPIFHGDRIIAWAGVALHDGDVGATVPGVHPAAPDSRHEGPLIPLVKLVEKGELRPDLEEWAVRTVRDPAANSLHIRCRMAAIVNTQRQMNEIIAEYGAETYLAFTRTYVERLGDALRTRLAELPDGTWQEELLIDHDGRSPTALSRVHCRMSKHGEKIRFDFTETDPPVPGPVNCSAKGLEAAVFSAVMSMLCYDTGWCPAALEQSVEIVTKPNTIVTAEYPTPVGLATVAAMSTAGGTVRACISKMFAGSAKYRERSRAFSGMAGTGSMIWGLDHAGKVRMTLGSFVVSRGAGAYCGRDGEDAGGNAGVPAASIYNVETVELANPLVLTLYRKEAPEAAGAGEFRGGAGMEIAFAIRPGFDKLHVNWGTMGFHHPHPKGLFGGLPGSVGGVQVLRQTSVAEQLERSRMPAGREEIECRSVTQMEAKTVDMQLDPGDVLVAWVEGGGGYGDPLNRSVDKVAADLLTGHCSVETARDIYGVIADPATREVDRAASSERRRTLRADRLGKGDTTMTCGAQEGSPVGAGLTLSEQHGERKLVCSCCGDAFGPIDEDPKEGASCRPTSFESFSSYNRFSFNGGEVDTREYLCKSCGSRIGLEIRRAGDGALYDMVLDPA